MKSQQLQEYVPALLLRLSITEDMAMKKQMDDEAYRQQFQFSYQV